MPGSIKSLKRRPTAKSAAKRIGRMFKRTNSDDPEATSPADSGFSKDSFESSRVSTSSRFSTSSSMTAKENIEQPRPPVSRYDTAPPKEREVVPPHPFFSSNSEPLLEHGKPVGPGMTVQTEKVIEPGTLPSPVDIELGDEPKLSQTKLEHKPQLVEKPEDMDNASESLQQITTPKQAPCPLPEPPVKKNVPPETQVADSPKKIQRGVQGHPSAIAQVRGEDVTEGRIQRSSQRLNPSQKLRRIKKTAVPPSTVEDEPKPIVIAVKVQAKPKPKAELQHSPPIVDHQAVSKAQPKDVQPKMEPKLQPKTQIHKKSSPVQPLPSSEVTQKPSKAPSSEVLATSSAPNVPTTPSAIVTSSAPRASSIPNTASVPVYSVTLNTTTIFVAKTAPAPYTARAPTTAPAPVIATAPKVVMSMLGWTLPKPAPIPKRARSPATSWIVSSA
ncbi:hypothetical protein FVEG_09612 [Fusarium verticillioides 7600]|uniref:Uncharacterized protein n=1 Tax=Gibberella moniliformis (strain M3125 / FGSC 7600) TaxID=334819 RepID=W7MHR9_GIBM7|nr:hypothetical protein FVEG_09612 [Fusarium verticillioides 7600]EWG50371.1 hypothetical protein FVEG_09612 [Fusarium verticillioides 7600]